MIEGIRGIGRTSAVRVNTTIVTPGKKGIQARSWASIRGTKKYFISERDSVEIVCVVLDGEPVSEAPGDGRPYSAVTQWIKLSGDGWVNTIYTSLPSKKVPKTVPVCTEAQLD